MGRAADVFSLGCAFMEMLTVRQMHSLEKFNHQGVKRWLNERIARDKNDSILITLIKQIFSALIENPSEDRRPE